jgi:hypothetical protein
MEAADAFERRTEGRTTPVDVEVKSRDNRYEHIAHLLKCPVPLRSSSCRGVNRL